MILTHQAFAPNYNRLCSIQHFVYINMLSHVCLRILQKYLILWNITSECKKFSNCMLSAKHISHQKFRVVIKESARASFIDARRTRMQTVQLTSLQVAQWTRKWYNKVGYFHIFNLVHPLHIVFNHASQTSLVHPKLCAQQPHHSHTG